MTHTGLSAEAVWGVLEPLGWEHKSFTRLHKFANDGLEIDMDEVSGWIHIGSVRANQREQAAPALAALSRLLGGDA